MHVPVDPVAPYIEILLPENKTYGTSSVSLNFTIDEATSWIGYSLDGKENVTIGGNTTIVGLSDGSHDIVVHAKDFAGNNIISEAMYFSIKTQTEPFPILIVAPIVIILVVGAALLVFFTKFRQ